MKISLRTKKILHWFLHKPYHIQDRRPFWRILIKICLWLYSLPPSQCLVMPKENVEFPYQEMIFSTLQVESTGALLWAQSRDPQWSRDVWGKNWQSPENWGHHHCYLNLKLRRQPRVFSVNSNACTYEKTNVKVYARWVLWWLWGALTGQGQAGD